MAAGVGMERWAYVPIALVFTMASFTVSVFTQGSNSAHSGSTWSDADICEGIKRGDAWAAEALYARTHSVIEATLHRILAKTRGDIEDLIQATHERLVRSLVQGRFAQQSSLSTWASAIAVHVAFDTARRMTVERRLFEHGELSSFLSENVAAPRALDRQLEARSEVELMQRLLARLTPERAQAVVLHDVLGHDLREVAGIQGVSVAAAQSRLVRGRKQLLGAARRYQERQSA